MQDDSRYEMSVTQWFQSQAVEFYDTGIQKLVPRYVSVPEANKLKNSSTLAVYVSINLSIKGRRT